MADLREAAGRGRTILQATGAAYAALHRADLPANRQQIEAMRRVHLSELAARLVNSLEARVTLIAGRVVENSLSEARQALQQHDPRRAVDVVVKSSNAKDYAAVEIRKSWQELRKRAGRAKLSGRVGIRVMPTN